MSQNIVNFPGASLRAEDARFTTFYANNVSMHASSGLEQITAVGHVTTTGIEISNIKPSTSSTTGALVVAGGVGVAGNVTVGSNLSVSGNVTVGSNLSVSGDTTVANLSVNGETVEVANLAVTSGSLELTQVSNLFQIKSSSNVVTEFKRSKKLIKYPRVAMSADDESSTTGYVASSSGTANSNYHAYEAFNNTGLVEGDGWVSAATYDTGTNYATTSATQFQNVYGEWLGIQLPVAIALKYCIIDHRQGVPQEPEAHPEEGYIYGSNDGTNWTVLKYFYGLTYGSPDFKNFNEHIEVNSSEYYTHFRIQGTKRLGQHSQSSPDAYLSIGDLELYGIPQNDPDATAVDVKIQSNINQPNDDWLDVHWDGTSYTTMPSSVTDESGTPSVTGTPNDVTFNSNWKAFEFNGTSSYITGTLNNAGGDAPYTVAVWFYVEPGFAEGRSLFQVGEQSDNEAINCRIKRHFVDWNHWDNDVTAQADFTEGQWHHLVGTYSGGGVSTFSCKLYKDGVLLHGVPKGDNFGALVNLAANEDFSLGAQRAIVEGHFEGMVADFRVFDRALSSDEVYQLWAHRSAFFQGNTNALTLKNGRVGMGTDEPKATLDVEGEARVARDLKVYGKITSFSKQFPYPRSKIESLNPTIWAVAGDSYARIFPAEAYDDRKSGKIVYYNVTVENMNGTPFWYARDRKCYVDIHAVIGHTDNSWTVALAVAKKPQSYGRLFNQIPSDREEVNHGIVWNGYFSGDEYGPSGGSWNNAGYGYGQAMENESLLVVRRNGTGSNNITVWLDGANVGYASPSETYNGPATPLKIRLFNRGWYSGYLGEAPMYMGIASVAVWDSALSDDTIRYGLSYDILSAR